MNIEKYTERARGFIQSAQTTALGKGHQQFAPIHLLKVLLDDDQGMANGLIERAGGDPKGARAAVEAALAKIPSVSGDGSQLYLSRELARVFDTAEQAAQKAGDSFVTVERLLLALASRSGFATMQKVTSIHSAIGSSRSGPGPLSPTAKTGLKTLPIGAKRRETLRTA